jgi:hypothetical protein
MLDHIHVSPPNPGHFLTVSHIRSFHRIDLGMGFSIVFLPLVECQRLSTVT